jgi:hypothetical protein
VVASNVESENGIPGLGRTSPRRETLVSVRLCIVAGWVLPYGVAVAVLCSASLAGCMAKQGAPSTANPPRTGGYDGAIRSIGAMVASPNRCAFSFVYDDFLTQRMESGQASPNRPNSRAAILRGPMHIAGASVKVAVRGAFVGDVGPIGTLLLEYGNAQTKVELVSDGKEGSHQILSELTGRASVGDNAVKVTVTLADPADGQKQQRVDIDSMDVAVDGEFCKTTAP